MPDGTASDARKGDIPGRLNRGFPFHALGIPASPTACFRAPLRSGPFGTAFGPLSPADAMSRAGERHARRSEDLTSVMPPARRLADGGSLRSGRVCSGSFSPHVHVGGEEGRLASGGGSLRSRFADDPPPPPAGERGRESEEKGIAVLLDRSRWSLPASSNACERFASSIANLRGYRAGDAR